MLDIGKKSINDKICKKYISNGSKTYESIVFDKIVGMFFTTLTLKDEKKSFRKYLKK